MFDTVDAIHIIFFVAIILITIFVWWYRSPRQKGKRGEKQVSSLLLKLSDDYHILNDVVFETEKGSTQIDHIVVSKYGVFAIETKNYRGEIYGDDNREKWTQIIVTEVRYRRKWWKIYTYVTKNQFYNPVKQSLGHTYRIKSLLKDYKQLPVVPIVVFVGEANLNNVETKNNVIYEGQLLSVIENYRNIYLSDNDVQKIIQLLECNNVRDSVDNKSHIRNLRMAEKERLETIDAGICPKCGGNLMKRNGKYGSFYGCSNYPKCRFTIN